MKQLKIFIACESFLIKEGLHRFLQKYPRFIVTEETDHPEILLSQILQDGPDIIFFEADICKSNVRNGIDKIRNSCSGIKIIVISDCAVESIIRQIVHSGIAGFVRKNASQEELALALKDVTTGRSYYTPEINEALSCSDTAERSPEKIFSDREIEILRYICKGWYNKQIADLLFISDKTVATHRRNIMKKAHIKKTSDLILWALNKKYF